MPLFDLPPPALQDLANNAGLNKVRSNSTTAGGKLVVAAASMMKRAVLGEIGNNKLTQASKSEETELKKHASRSHKKDIEEAALENAPPEIPNEEVKQGSRPRSFSSQNLNIEDIDAGDNNPQLVSCYAKDIYKYLHELEEKTTVRQNYMEGYKIRPNMRSILVDWLVDVHGRFKLLQETLYLAVSIMDRFCQIDSTVTRHDYQLIGLTSLFIASKFEEMFSPEINDFVYMSDRAYTRTDILRTEIRILRTLDFNLGRPLPIHFLRRYTKAATHVHSWVDIIHHTLSKYLMELSLPEYEFVHYPPSQLAAASLCLSLKIADESETSIEALWNDTLVYYSGYTVEALEPVLGKLCSLIIKAETNRLQAVRKKYFASKFYNISALPSFKSPGVVAFLGKMSLKK